MSDYAPHTLESYSSAVAVLAIIWVLYRVGTGNWNPAVLAEGADGRPSLSKFQFLLWTFAAVFGVAGVVAARLWGGEYSKIVEFPQNLLIATGFTTVTAAAARGITSSYVAGHRIVKRSAEPGTVSWAALVTDDDGFPDLSKVQMLSWTLIALGVFLVRVHSKLTGTAAPDVPDIDAPLMVLMGLGQAAYLGKKITSTDQPRLTAISPPSGPKKTTVTLFGLGFDQPPPPSPTSPPSPPTGAAAAAPTQPAKQPAGVITIDGAPFAADGLNWAPTQIRFTLPDKHPNGSDWTNSQQIAVGLLVGGVPSSNSLPFTVTQQGELGN